MHTASASIRNARPSGTSMPLPRALGLLLAITIAVALALLWAAPASAHAQLLETDPAEGAEVAEAPAQIVLTFNENIEQIGSDVVITDAQGTEVQDGDPQIDGHDVIQALIDDRPAGQYTVQWRVVSADGHPISGEFTFEALAAAAGEVPDDPAEDPADDPADDPAGTDDDDAGTDPDAADPTGDTGDETTADAGEESGDDTPADDLADSDEGGFPWGLIFALAGVGVVLALVVRARNQLRDRDRSDSGPGADHTEGGDADPNP